MEQGRVAVIFGGAAGIGLAVARRCKNNLGMKICIADIDKAQLELVRKEFPSDLCVYCDATDSEQVKKFADEIYSKYNDVGFLVNNTGIVRGNSAFKTSLQDSLSLVLKTVLPQLRL